MTFFTELHSFQQVHEDYDNGNNNNGNNNINHDEHNKNQLGKEMENDKRIESVCMHRFVLAEYFSCFFFFLVTTKLEFFFFSLAIAISNETK